MIKALSKVWQKALMLMGFVLALIVFSAFHAYKDFGRNNWKQYSPTFLQHPIRATREPSYCRRTRAWFPAGVGCDLRTTLQKLRNLIFRLIVWLNVSVGDAEHCGEATAASSRRY